MLYTIALFVTLVGLAAAQSSGQFAELINDLQGTWSTGSGAVRTGPVSFITIPFM